MRYVKKTKDGWQVILAFIHGAHPKRLPLLALEIFNFVSSVCFLTSATPVLLIFILDLLQRYCPLLKSRVYSSDMQDKL